MKTIIKFNFYWKIVSLTANGKHLDDVTPHPLRAAKAKQTSTNLSRCMNLLNVTSASVKWTLDSVSSSDVVRSLKLNNVWVFVQLISGPRWPMNQLNKNIA